MVPIGSMDQCEAGTVQTMKQCCGSMINGNHGTVGSMEQWFNWFRLHRLLNRLLQSIAIEEPITTIDCWNRWGVDYHNPSLESISIEKPIIGWWNWSMRSASPSGSSLCKSCKRCLNSFVLYSFQVFSSSPVTKNKKIEEPAMDTLIDSTIVAINS